jgi:hypothetical protein
MRRARTVGVRDEDAVLRLAEEEGEGVERPGRAKPGKLVRGGGPLAGRNARQTLANRAVDPVRRYHQVCVSDFSQVGNLAPENELHPELTATFMQNGEQRLARAAAEAVAADPVDGPLKWISRSSQ